MVERDETMFWGRLQKAMDDQGCAERGRPTRLSYALASGHGLSASADTIRSWASIKGVPQDTRLVFALAKILKVDADYLFGRDQFEDAAPTQLPGAGRLLRSDQSEAARRARRRIAEIDPADPDLRGAGAE